MQRLMQVGFVVFAVFSSARAMDTTSGACEGDTCAATHPDDEISMMQLSLRVNKTSQRDMAADMASDCPIGGFGPNMYLPSAQSFITITGLVADDVKNVEPLKGSGPIFNGGWVNHGNGVPILGVLRKMGTDDTWFMCARENPYTKVIELTFRIEYGEVQVKQSGQGYKAESLATTEMVCSNENLILSWWNSKSNSACATCDHCGGYGIEGLQVKSCVATTTTTTTTTTLPPTTLPPATTIAPVSATSSECLAKPNWHAGYGACDTYAPGLITNGAENYAYCDMDKSRTGVMASETCEECGTCFRLPACASVANWHAGYGSCDTYAPGLITDGAENFAYCDLDKSRTGVMASEACEECGQCSISNPSTLASTSTSAPTRLVQEKAQKSMAEKRTRNPRRS